MRHISVQNVRVETRSILPVIIAGLDSSPIEDVRLSNIRISTPIGMSANSLKTFPARVPEDVKGYPQNQLTFGLKLPTSTFYVKNVTGLVLDKVVVTHPQYEARPTVYLDKANGMKLKNIVINDTQLTNTKAMMLQVNSERIDVNSGANRRRFIGSKRQSP